jgi:hypothetical protein
MARKTAAGSGRKIICSTVDAKLRAAEWTFTYLGTQPETWADAQNIRIAAGGAFLHTAMANVAYAAKANAVHSLAFSKRLNSMR